LARARFCRRCIEGRATDNTAAPVTLGKWLPGIAVDGGVAAQGFAGDRLEKTLWPKRDVVSSHEPLQPKREMSAIIACLHHELTGLRRVMRWKSEKFD
jgi:hypothetical protein